MWVLCPLVLTSRHVFGHAPIWAVFDDLPMIHHGAADFVHDAEDCAGPSRSPCVCLALYSPCPCPCPSCLCLCATAVDYCRDDNCRYRVPDNSLARATVAGVVLAIQNLRRLDLLQE